MVLSRYSSLSSVLTCSAMLFFFLMVLLATSKIVTSGDTLPGPVSLVGMSGKIESALGSYRMYLLP